MLRFEVSEAGLSTLPAIDLDASRVEIGSGTAARIRLPAHVARARHVSIEDGHWIAHDAVIVDGEPRRAGERAPLAAGGAVFELGGYRVRVAQAPAGTAASPPQRTESLARELVRSLLGAGAAPAFEIERGPALGSSRALPPPEATLVIGRGDEAGWVILDEDLSREHVEIRRGWDGVTVRDLDSKNGTLVDGVRITDVTELHDGAQLELGNVVLRFRDPAERHLRGEPTTPLRAPRTSRTSRTSRQPAVAAVAPDEPAQRWLFVAAVTLAALAAIGLAWVLAS